MDKTSTFLGWLDLERDGLRQVKQNASQNKSAEAAEELLRYFRIRKVVNYYDGWDKRQLNPRYDTSKADQICRNHLVGQDLPQDIDLQANPRGDPEWKFF